MAGDIAVKEYKDGALWLTVSGRTFLWTNIDKAEVSSIEKMLAYGQGLNALKNLQRLHGKGLRMESEIKSATEQILSGKSAREVIAEDQDSLEEQKEAILKQVADNLGVDPEEVKDLVEQVVGLLSSVDGAVDYAILKYRAAQMDAEGPGPVSDVMGGPPEGAGNGGEEDNDEGEEKVGGKKKRKGQKDKEDAQERVAVVIEPEIVRKEVLKVAPAILGPKFDPSIIDREIATNYNKVDKTDDLIQLVIHMLVYKVQRGEIKASK